MPTIERQGAEIYYETHGDGPPLVLVHGAGGSTIVWWQQVPYFAPRYRVVVLDQRGFGRSRCAPDSEGARYFTADLEAVLDAAGVEAAALICQSMGGWTGLQLALRRPERVHALLLSGTPAGVQTPKVVEAFAALAQSVGAEMNRSPRWDTAHPAIAADAFERDPSRAFLYGQIAGLNPPGAVLRSALHEVRADPEALRRHRVPTLLVGGENDRLFPPPVLREVAAAIPGAHFHEIPRVGHSPYFEAPEEFNRIAQEFLDRHWPGALVSG